MRGRSSGASVADRNPDRGPIAKAKAISGLRASSGQGRCPSPHAISEIVNVKLWPGLPRWPSVQSLPVHDVGLERAFDDHADTKSGLAGRCLMVSVETGSGFMLIDKGEPLVGLFGSAIEERVTAWRLRPAGAAPLVNPECHGSNKAVL